MIGDKFLSPMESPKIFVLPVMGTKHTYKLAVWKETPTHQKYKGYIEFYCYNLSIDKPMHRTREYWQYHLREDIQKRIDEINAALIAGKVLGTEEDKNKVGTVTLSQAVKFYTDNKHTKKENSLKTYKYKVRLFLEWAQKNELDTIAIDKINKEHLQRYLDYCRKTLKNGDVTLESKLLNLTNFFNFLVSRGVLSASPALQIKHAKKSTKYKELITKDEIKRFSEVCEVEDAMLYCFVNFLYHNHIRPNELRQLQKKHIDLSTDRLTVPENIAKNGHTRFTVITPPLRELILKHKIVQGNQEDYLFGDEQGRVYSSNYWGHRHREFRRKHDFSESTKLYRWKDVGVTAYYMQFKDAYYIMRQCGHRSLEETQIYLSKDLGIFETGLDLTKAPTM